jgi:hypothetical protein
MASLEKPLGPGHYLPDLTEGVHAPQELPRPILLQRSRNYRHRRCPECGRSAYRLRSRSRQLHDLGDRCRGRPRELRINYSQHHCRHCGRYFNAPMLDLAAPHSQYTHRVVQTAVALVVEDGLPYRSACWHLWRDQRVFVPFATIQNWVEAGGKKGAGRGRGALPGRGRGAVQRVPGRGRTARRALYRTESGG